MFLRVSVLSFAVLMSFAGVSLADNDKVNPQRIADNSASQDFIVAGGDGYGTSECLAEAGHCGRIVADAWCESKGFARSAGYRLADREETTASISQRALEQAFVITCSPK